MIPHRILFIAEGQLGDLLLLTPALRATKTAFPHSRVTVLVLQRRHYGKRSGTVGRLLVRSPAGGTCSVLASNPNVDCVVEIDRQTLRSLRGILRIRAEIEIVRYLRSEQFDTVICTFPEDRFVAWALLTGAKIRVGQKDQGLRRLLTRTPDVHKEMGGVLRYYSDLAAAAGAHAVSDTTEFFIPETSRQWAQDFLKEQGLGRSRRLVAIHPGASGPHRMWPPERFAQLAVLIEAKSGAKTIVCGSEHDAGIVGEVKRLMGGHPVEAQFSDSIPNFAALLECCMLCISNDSGPRHLAAAVGTASLAFAPRFNAPAWKIYEDEEQYGTLEGKQECPVCPPGECRNIIPAGEVYGSYCLRMIQVEEVFERVRSIISFSS